ncbi:hypothetical protein RF11_06578 [Thelohanellus kitauei]|uniref:Uncharacterized protein n=1 Tax=Thelohanellus kitauei TaxID=669202 RepID=A0A0C2NEJ9_THEKT|nr:hypothetical protein RF11_06578 [Thelohanellus kitauei]
MDSQTLEDHEYFTLHCYFHQEFKNGIDGIIGPSKECYKEMELLISESKKPNADSATIRSIKERALAKKRIIAESIQKYYSDAFAKNIDFYDELIELVLQSEFEKHDKIIQAITLFFSKYIKQIRLRFPNRAIDPQNALGPDVDNDDPLLSIITQVAPDPEDIHPQPPAEENVSSSKVTNLHYK